MIYFKWNIRKLRRWIHNNFTSHDWDAEVWNTWFDTKGYNEHLVIRWCECGEWDSSHNKER